MSTIKLQRLTLSNFKGIKALTLDLAGRNASIYGANATGKTTIYDAFLWLLFDKDSSNKSAFNIKTLDESGEPLHGLDHEVEAVLSVDGQELTLKKSYKEKWTKRRGSATAEFTGHTTDYYIDGVPAKKSEYDAKIAELVHEDVFKLLTSPTYFNEQLHWQDRREILLEVCGDISDDDVIASDKALAKLPKILKGRSLDDHLKIIAAQRKRINKELEQLPTRIDEVMRGLPDVSGVDPDCLPRELKETGEAIRAKETEISKLKTGGGIADKARELDQFESEIVKLKAEAHKATDTATQAKRQELGPIRMAMMDCRAEIEQAQKNIGDLGDEIARLDAEIPKLRGKWHGINDQQWDGDETCPTCNQPLPADQIEDAIAAFNRQKAEQLEQINTAGKDAAEKRKGAGREMETTRHLLAELEDGLQKLTAQETAILAELEALMLTTQTAEVPGLDAKLAERKRLETEIEAIKAGSSEVVEKATAELRKLESTYKRLETDRALLHRYSQGQERIDELKIQERELAAEYEALEEQLYLCEQFIRAKVGLLEDKINSKFEMARFKLFEQQVNGALNEVCDTTYGGVPYGDMNNAARINTGLDIIRTLSKHYRFSAPIFIDNSEAVVQLLPIDSQVIRLVVSGADKQLRIERDEQ